MRRLSLIATSIVAAVALCVGCASSNPATSGNPGGGTAGSGSSATTPAATAPATLAPPGHTASAQPGSASATAPGSSGIAGAPVSSAPVGSVPPTGPAASAATGAPPAVGTHAVATVAGATVSCPDGAPLADPGNGRGEGPTLGDGVQIKAVVRCETVLRTYAGIGQWSVQLAEVADSGLAPFLAELRKPSAKRPTNLMCPMYLRVAPWFALVDDSGAVLQPPIPTDQCGQISGTAMAALAKLDFRAVDAVRVRQTESPEVIKTGCQQNWKDMVAFEAGRRPAAITTVGTGPVGTAGPTASALVCLYTAGVAEGGLRTGTLIKGGTVHGVTATNIAGESGYVVPIGPGCADAATFAVITYGAGSAAYVEMDGCRRLLTTDNRLGVASPKLIAQVNAALALS